MLAQELPHTHNEAEMHSERRSAALPQRCTRCQAEIPPGTFFTHRTLGATGVTHLICARCQPFRLVDLPLAVERGVTRHLGA
jgi:hypothetical protein